MTDRIEAIRARLESRKAFRVKGVTTWTSEADDDVAVLLAEVEQAHTRIAEVEKDWEAAYGLLREELDGSEAHRTALRIALEQVKAERDAAEVKFRALYNDALAPVAPDAEPGGALTIEPTKAGSRVRDARGRLWHLNGKGDGYAGAWRLTPGGALPWACLVRDYGPLTLEPTP